MQLQNGKVLRLEREEPGGGLRSHSLGDVSDIREACSGFWARRGRPEPDEKWSGADFIFGGGRGRKMADRERIR
jgi:hypothetical protein